MKLASTSIVILGALTATAAAQPKKAPAPTATLPVVGDTLTTNGGPTWAKRDWLYDVPSDKDAAGKVVIHWFCAPKVKTCSDDLARIVTMKENGRVYIVAHINGNKGQAKKLDPIRESEGVGQGSVAFGKGATALMKQMGITGPASVVVDLEGKVALVTTSAAPADLDARDKKVAELIAAIKEYKLTNSESPKDVKAGDKFTFTMSVNLAKWLTYAKKTPMSFKLTAPPDFKCDAKELKGDQLKVENNILTASVSCTAPKGIYEARGELNFGYDTPSNASGLGTEGAKWKFEVKP
ncbi:MAG: hypothetical protein H0T46_37715 [Deltaproteobacteria bacterium]|nr:hypothetical protein [Deltaproteobacteria bacterium]